VQIVADILSLMRETDCDMVMAGRALTARPWLFWQLGEALGFAPPPGREGQRAPSGPLEEGAEYGRSLKRLLTLMTEHFSEDLTLRKSRFFIRTGAPWLQFGHDLYARSTKAKTTTELALALEDFFAREQSMTSRTELRQ
jgi:tRNA-dihydrouridine synthase